MKAAEEPKLSPGNGFFLQPDGNWGVDKIPPEVLREVKFSGHLTILGYKCVVFEMPDGSQWAQKSTGTAIAIDLHKIAQRLV